MQLVPSLHPGSTPAVHVDNMKKDILFLCKVLMQGLDDTSTIAKTEYFIKFSRSKRKFCLDLHYNGSNSFNLLTLQK